MFFSLRLYDKSYQNCKNSTREEVNFSTVKGEINIGLGKIFLEDT